MSVAEIQPLKLVTRRAFQGDAPMAWSADRFQKLGEGGSVQVAKERMVFGMFFLIFLCFFVSVSRGERW